MNPNHLDDMKLVDHETGLGQGGLASLDEGALEVDTHELDGTSVRQLGQVVADDVEGPADTSDRKTGSALPRCAMRWIATTSSRH